MAGATEKYLLRVPTESEVATLAAELEIPEGVIVEAVGVPTMHGELDGESPNPPVVAFSSVVFSSVRRIGRTVVLVLLSWTALDVLNPALCELDELPFLAANATVDSNTAAPTEPPVTPEDCFCCSHNVSFKSIAQFAVSLPSVSERRIAVDETPRWSSFPLYHPPRLIS